MLRDYTDKAVLITGGTSGIGLATGLAFAKQGAHCILTYKWGNNDIDAIKESFLSQGHREPLIIQSDVAIEEDVQNLVLEIAKYHKKVEVFISNVSFALLTKSLDEYSERGLFKSIEYSAWPIVSITKEIKKTFNCYPRYIWGLSSNGPSSYQTNYDFVASSKALMETMVRYLNYGFKDKDVIVNVLRPRTVKTESLRATYGDDFTPFGEKYDICDLFIEAKEVGDALLAFCSGLMDSVRGQVIYLDKGSTFSDNIMNYYDNRFKINMQ